MGYGNFRFELEKYTGPASRYTCPACGKQREFTRYIDNQTGEYVGSDFGRCNREQKCGYHKRPEPSLNNGLRQVYSFPPTIKQASQPIIEIPETLVNRSLTKPGRDHFTKWLLTHFTREEVLAAIQVYRLGLSCKHWKNAVIFWQIDLKGKTRTGKIMDYNPETGHRVKGRVNWVHKRLKSVEGGCLQQCLFGLHLVNRKENAGKPICIVESEKTAVFMSMLIKQGVWLATGGKQRLKEEELRQFGNRKVILFPDQG
jgi:hypothetical protein